MVVGHHAGLGPRSGFLGVDVFFVVSGFVVGRVLWTELSRTGSVRLRSFAARRVRRLVPALAVCTVVTAVASALVLSPFGPQQLAYATGAAATVFVANLEIYRTTGYLDGSAEANPFLHTWSLSVEEQFYVVLPLLLLAACRLARRGWTPGPGADPARLLRVVTAGGATIAAGSAALSFLLAGGVVTLGLEAPARFAFLAMPTRVWQFAVGVLLALRGDRAGRAGRAAAGAMAAVGLTAVLAASVLMDPDASHPAGWAALVVAGVALVLLAGGGDGSGPGARLLGCGPLTWIGDRSYSWYLWHWPAIVLAALLAPGRPVALAAAALGSLLPAALSYRFVERPVRFGPHWQGRRTLLVAAVGLLGPLAVLGGLALGASTGWGLREPLDWYDLPQTFGTACHVLNRDTGTEFDPSACSFGPEPAAGTVLLVGDDLAESVGPAVVEAAGANAWRTIHWSRAGCPMVGPGSRRVGSSQCTAWQDRVVALADELRPDVIVVANQALEPAGRPAFERTVERWSAQRIPVVLVAPIADFGDRFPRRRLSLLTPDPDAPTVARDHVERDRRGVMAALESVAQRDGVVVVDPLPVLCDRECAAAVGDRWRYLGPRSLTATAARQLTDRFRLVFGDA